MGCRNRGGTKYHFNFNDGVNDPTPANVGQNHAKNCAGIIAASGFNNIGVIGVAPDAHPMGLRLMREMRATIRREPRWPGNRTVW